MKKLPQIHYNNIEPTLKHCSGSQKAVSQMGAVNAGQKKQMVEKFSRWITFPLYTFMQFTSVTEIVCYCVF